MGQKERAPRAKKVENHCSCRHPDKGVRMRTKNKKVTLLGIQDISRLGLFFIGFVRSLLLQHASEQFLPTCCYSSQSYWDWLALLVSRREMSTRATACLGGIHALFEESCRKRSRVRLLVCLAGRQAAVMCPYCRKLTCWEESKFNYNAVNNDYNWCTNVVGSLNCLFHRKMAPDAMLRVALVINHHIHRWS